MFLRRKAKKKSEIVLVEPMPRDEILKQVEEHTYHESGY